MTARRCQKQRSRPIHALGRHVGAVLDEASREFQVTDRRRRMQRNRPVLVLDRHVGVVLYKEPREIQMAVFQCQLQRSRPVLLLQLADTSAPCSIRMRASSTFPCCDARSNGVGRPLMPPECTWSGCLTANNFTTASKLQKAA